jgi:FKBP-type peptidyl-prolyl cis-trans isomerase FkpA
MKKILGLALVLLVAATSCKKLSSCEYSDSSATASSAERDSLRNYLTLNSIPFQEHSSGVFYTLNSPGTGNTPDVCSQIVVKYSGFLLNGVAPFDSYSADGGLPMTLGRLIVGWQKGLSVVKAGGLIVLYIPPSLGYGADPVRDGNGNTVIPANSYLKFSIELLAVN